MRSAISRRGLLIAGSLALLCMAFLVVGAFLPSRVQVTRTISVHAPATSVYPYLSDLGKWDEWTPWGDVESRIEGPAEGVGSRRVWDDPAVGAGSLTLVQARAPIGVEYVVDVEDGAIRFEGTISVSSGDSASTITWVERVQLGRNPILRWTALTLEGSQGRLLAANLGRLKQLLEADPGESRGPAPATGPQDPTISTPRGDGGVVPEAHEGRATSLEPLQRDRDQLLVRRRLAHHPEQLFHRLGRMQTR